MPGLLILNARVLTLDGPDGPRRGSELHELGVIEHGFVLAREGVIVAVGDGDPDSSLLEEDENIAVVDAGGRVLMPAFVDCHTHACWAGDRLDEFEMGLRGASYLQILERGGGIMSTVRSVRKAPREELADCLECRLGLMASHGTAAAEIKSGYGLTTESEIKMLRAIHDASQVLPQEIVGTFLGAHAMDEEQDHFVDVMIDQSLPAIVAEFPGIACDAYCEQSAWSVQDTTRLFERAKDLGCPLHLHVDQFNALGMLPRALEMGVHSVAHMEASASADLIALARSDTIAVLLPLSGFCTDGRYAQGRLLADEGAAIALATNYNPGSAPCPSMPLAIAVACRRLRLTPAEAISAATHNAACVIGLEDRVGRLAPGHRADLQLLECQDERELAWHVASGGPLLVCIGGEVVHLLAEADGEDEE